MWDKRFAKFNSSKNQRIEWCDGHFCHVTVNARLNSQMVCLTLEGNLV